MSLCRITGGCCVGLIRLAKFQSVNDTLREDHGFTVRLMS